MGTLYGCSAPGAAALNPGIVRTYQTGQLASVPSGVPVIHSWKPTTTQRNDLLGLNGTTAKNATLAVGITYFENVVDLVSKTQYFCVDHEYDNNTGATAATAKAVAAAVLAGIKPTVNAFFTGQILWGQIMTGNFFLPASTGNNATMDAWFAAGLDFIGGDPYANLTLITNQYNYAVHYGGAGFPWLLGEFGTSATAISTDTANVAHINAGKTAWTSVATPPVAVCWFANLTTMITTTLTSSVTAGQTSVPVAGLPGTSTAGSLPSSSPIQIDPLGTLDAVTTSGGSVGTSSPFTLPITPALGHNHSSGAVVWLSPSAVALWRSLNTTGTTPAILSPPTGQTVNQTAVAALTINITLPATINAGDMIYLFESERATSPSITWPAGFTAITLGSGSSGGASLQLSGAEKVAAGTEGGTVVTVTSSASTVKTVIAVVWPGVFGTISASTGSNGPSSKNVVGASCPVAGQHYGVLAIGTADATAAQTWTPALGFTEAAHTTSAVAGGTALFVGYNIDSGTASNTGTITNIVSAANQWASIVLVLQPGTNAGGQPVGAVPGFVDGTIVHHADEVFALAPPVMYRYQNTQQALIATATSTLITFDTTVTDTEVALSGTHTDVTSSRWQPATPGSYLVIATLNWALNATGSRQLDLRKNAAGAAAGGTRIDIDARAATPGLISTNIVVAYVNMNGTTDYLEMFGYQSSGGNLGVFSANQANSWSGSIGMITKWLNS